jgi:hypothetical protein
MMIRRATERRSGLSGSGLLVRASSIQNRIATLPSRNHRNLLKTFIHDPFESLDIGGGSVTTR